jgi:hypothetical protein
VRVSSILPPEALPILQGSCDELALLGNRLKELADIATRLRALESKFSELSEFLDELTNQDIPKKMQDIRTRWKNCSGPLGELRAYLENDMTYLLIPPKSAANRPPTRSAHDLAKELLDSFVVMKTAIDNGQSADIKQSSEAIRQRLDVALPQHQSQMERERGWVCSEAERLKSFLPEAAAPAVVGGGQ